MNANKALWEKGDFTRLAATMRESGEELIASLGVERGMDVLDLGCATEPLLFQPPSGAPTFVVSTSPPTSSPPAELALPRLVSPTCASRKATHRTFGM